MARLVLVDTADELPGLLPLHAWSALMSTELVVIGDPGHPFVGHLDAAELRWEAVGVDGEAALSRADLLSGLTPADKRRAEAVVDRAREHGEVVYLFGGRDDDAFTRTLGMEAARAGLEVEIVYFGVRPAGTRLLDLVRIEERLRGAEGCPWDREQDHRSLARYAVEEVFELIEAIESGDDAAIRDELGDVLLQVVFHAQIAADEGRFTIDDVAAGIVDKLVRRHPHVFAGATVSGSDEVVANWDELKAAERPERRGVFDGVVAAQPALGYADKLHARAAKAGAAGSATDLGALRTHLDEAVAADDAAERERALGDLLMGVVGLARDHALDPETALRGAAHRFRARIETATDGS